MSPIVRYQYLGQVDYPSAWAHQTGIHQSLIDRKRSDVPLSGRPEHTLILCEHPPVFTLGRSGKDDHLLLDDQRLTDIGATYHRINRGGDITFHGPGQIVGYPILDLEDFYRDVHRYVRSLEEVIIRVLADYGLSGIRMEGYTGVWLPPDAVNGVYRKICAIGVHLSRWVTLHGFAFNIDTDLSYFSFIIPCGIRDEDKAVTSLSLETGRRIDLKEVRSRLLHHFSDIFQCTLQPDPTYAEGY